MAAVERNVVAAWGVKRSLLDLRFQAMQQQRRCTRAASRGRYMDSPGGSGGLPSAVLGCGLGARRGLDPHAHRPLVPAGPPLGDAAWLRSGKKKNGCSVEQRQRGKNRVTASGACPFGG